MVGTYTSTYVLRRTTTGAATGNDAELTLDGSAPSGSANTIALSNDSTSVFDIMITARRTDVDGESAAFNIKIALDRQTNAASTAIVGGEFKTILGRDSSLWDVSTSANTTTGGLKLSVTCEAGKSISWVAFVRETKSVG
jgi:hypothetical protein